MANDIKRNRCQEREKVHRRPSSRLILVLISQRGFSLMVTQVPKNQMSFPTWGTQNKDFGLVMKCNHVVWNYFGKTPAHGFSLMFTAGSTKSNMKVLHGGPKIKLWP